MCIRDRDLILEKEDAHYLTNVMRLREGDNVFLFNSKDGEFKGEITSSDKKNIKVKLISKIENINKPGNISLIFSLIKSSKLDYLIQKCTEVGVKSFSPIISEKSVAKLSKNTDHPSNTPHLYVNPHNNCGQNVILFIKE